MRLVTSAQHLQPNSELDRQLEEAAFELEAEHDSAYRRARQAHLSQALVDSGQPRRIGLLQKYCEGIVNLEASLEHAAEQMDAVSAIGQLRDAFRSLPPDVKQDIQQTAKLMWNVRGLYWVQFLAAFNQIFFQNPQGWRQALLSNRAQTVVQLARLAGKSAGLPPSSGRATKRRGIGGSQVKQYHRRQMQRGIVPGRNRQTGRYRELEYEQALENELDRATLELEGPEPFFTKVTPIPGIGNKEGHEILTRVAMRGLPLSAADQSAILLGVIRPDRGGRSYWNFPRAALESLKAAAQPAHSLRPTMSSTVAAALRLIRARFFNIYLRAMRATSRKTALEWIGEGLHLLQDSFSPAHVARVGGTGNIRHIRAFYIRLGWPPLSRAPHEHNAPSDPRDDVYLHGAIRPEARAAIRASQEFLRMTLRHLQSPRSPRNAVELHSFMRGYLTT